ncbi:DUF1127 domain-containing protein [Phreatobacter aquaticus]|nr:DUF1127 domain-containing protein [Phreatobacter aquaticus]
MTMFAVTFGSAVLSVASVVRAQVNAFNRWLEARRDYRALCEMDDKTLADIGLTRSDIRDATAAGYFGDPTVIVAARAVERGAHRPQRHALNLTGPSLVPDVASGLAHPVAAH